MDWRNLLCSLIVALSVTPTLSDDPFLPPKLTASTTGLDHAFSKLESGIKTAVHSRSAPWNTSLTHFAIEVTSAEESLWKTSHTASGSTEVTDQTYFRIGSVSKVYTVLTVLLLQKQGKWSIKDPIAKHVPELRDGENKGGMKWDEITLETLASQLSGIPREYAQGDWTDAYYEELEGIGEPIEFGLPPVSGDEVPKCAFDSPGVRPCSRQELISGFKRRTAAFAPNYLATYSNVAFILLGLALESLTGQNYEAVISSTIFEPFDLRHTTLTKPADREGAIPNVTNDWNSDLSTYNPTGGIYSTTSDLCAFARAILTNQFFDESATNAWFHPRSFSSDPGFSYGMPWEIFRTDALLEDMPRFQTIVTKAGGVQGYTSQFLLLPEYNIAMAVLVAGDGTALSWLREETLKAIVPAVEEVSKQQADEGYSGSYVASSSELGALNSSISVTLDKKHGLLLTSWISNGTDFLAGYKAVYRRMTGRGPDHTQLFPTRLRRGTSGQGEVWRVRPVANFPSTGVVNTNLIEDVDSFTYASRAVEEFVFLYGEENTVVGVELPALRITLKKEVKGRRTNLKNSGSEQKLLGGTKSF